MTITTHRPSTRTRLPLRLIVAVTVLLSTGAWTSPAGASYYDGVVTTSGPSGSSMSTGSGTCTAPSNRIQTGTTAISPATGYQSQWVRVRVWFHDLTTGQWSSLPWSAWARAYANNVAVFTPATGATPIDYRPHRYEVVMQGAWYFSNGTTRYQNLTVGYYLQQTLTNSSYGTTCFA